MPWYKWFYLLVFIDRLYKRLVFLNMNFKTNSKKICIFIALILFVNPILASANSLFMNGSSSFTTVHDQSTTAETSSVTCHDEAKSEPSLSNNSASNKISPDNIEANNCCADICHCDDAGCQAVSLLFNTNSQAIFSSNEIINFSLPIYISLTFLPNSPPPII